MINKNTHPSPSNKCRAIIQIFIIMSMVFVSMFIWLGSAILVNKMGIDISAERLLLGIVALMMGGLWAWLSLKGKMPFAKAFAKEGQPLPQPTIASQSLVGKWMRGLFVLVGMGAWVALAMMPEAMVYSFFRIFAFGRFFDTLGLLALLAMMLVFIVDNLIATIKHKLMPHPKPKEKSPHINWYLFATITWIQLTVAIISFLLIIYKYLK